VAAAVGRQRDTRRAAYKLGRTTIGRRDFAVSGPATWARHGPSRRTADLKPVHTGDCSR